MEKTSIVITKTVCNTLLKIVKIEAAVVILTHDPLVKAFCGAVLNRVEEKLGTRNKVDYEFRFRNHPYARYRDGARRYDSFRTQD